MPFVLKSICLPTSISTEGVSGEKRFSNNSHDGNLTKKLKAPSASSIVVMDSAPKVVKAKKLPSVAPCNLVVFHVTNNAGDVWSEFEGCSGKLWQVQIDHAARHCY